MVRVPGNLDTVALTCGRDGCHAEIARRVQGSIMATAVGMVAVDRFAFGEAPTPDGSTPVRQLGDSPADTHLRQLCASCHLGMLKLDPAPPSELSRGGGCVACHLRAAEGDGYSPERSRAFVHSRLSVAVDDESCFGCHSRSGRISLNYAGWTEISPEPAEREDHPGRERRVLEDDRVLGRVSPDIHYEQGMACIDCHTAGETMGDGSFYAHEEDATEITCSTCHRSEPPETASWRDLDPETRAIVRLREGAESSRLFVRSDERGRPLSNVSLTEDGRVAVRGKLDGEIRYATPPAPECRSIDGHERLACRACHAAWAPQCISCHTQYDPTGRSIDVLTGQQRDGQWVEYHDEALAEPPVLGVRTRNGTASVEPFVPGMIMTLNLPETGRSRSRPPPAEASSLIGPATVFRRMHAPVAPHTTTRPGRSCRSCHNEAAAVGLGRGKLELSGTSEPVHWRFQATYERLPQDGLPADAWVGFGTTQRGGAATRSDARALTPREQEAVLRVGACINCHDPDDPQQAPLYEDFATSLRLRQSPCLSPTILGLAP